MDRLEQIQETSVETGISELTLDYIKMNIEVSKNEDTGIYCIVVYGLMWWEDYKLKRAKELDKIIISITDIHSSEYIPGYFDLEEIELRNYEIFVEEGFNTGEYLITTMQDINKLTIICIPADLKFNPIKKK